VDIERQICKSPGVQFFAGDNTCALCKSPGVGRGGGERGPTLHTITKRLGEKVLDDDLSMVSKMEKVFIRGPERKEGADS
jgi:hypothetical protein